MTANPLVVAILHSNEEDAHYQVYSQAYGLEMQIDDQWNAELVLLVPPDHLGAITEETGVTSEDTAIVSAGVIDIPLDENGQPEIARIRDERNNWLLVGDARSGDSDNVINLKIHAALDADCRVVLLVTKPDLERLAAWLNGNGGINGTKLVVAYAPEDGVRPRDLELAARQIREHMASLGVSGTPRFIATGAITSNSAHEILAIDGVDGVMLRDNAYNDFGAILELLSAIG